MATITVTRRIQAPPEVVFQVIADPRQFAKAIAGVARVELLSDVASGAGAKFRQFRIMKGKATTMDFAVTECATNERVRIVNESHGTTWDSLFTIAPWNLYTTLTMRMETTTKPFLPRLLMPLICLLIEKSVEKDIEAVQVYCEERAAATRSAVNR